MLQLNALDSLDPARGPLTPISPRSPGCVVPLTAEQLRSWREMVGGEQVSLRVCVSSVRIVGTFDSSVLRESIDILLQRHESLRTRIALHDGAPHQLIDARAANSFESVNVESAAKGDPGTEVTRLVQQFADEEIRLSVGPVFKAMLFRVSLEDHVLILMLDHMVSDATSWQILNSELWKVYDQVARRGPVDLDPLHIQYADYAVWQERSHKAWSEAHQAYWIQRLANAPGMHGPPDGLVLNAAPEGMMLHFPLGKALTVKLRQAADRAQASVPIVTLCLYIAALSRWRRSDDIVVAFISHGRYGRPELKNVVGFLTTSLHLRMKVPPGHRLIELLRCVQDELAAAYRHQDFGQIVHFLPQYTAELFFNWVPSEWAGMSLKPRSQTDQRFRRQAFPLRIVRPTRFFYGFFYDGPAGIGCTFYFDQRAVLTESVRHLDAALRSAAEEFVSDSSAYGSPMPVGAKGSDQ